MKLLKNKVKISLLSLTLFGIILCGMLATTVSASLNYNSTLAKGTEEFTIDKYADAAWKSTVNPSTTPSFWFEGDANITGAKSKATLRGWNYITWQMYDVLTSVFISEYFNINSRYFGHYPVIG